MNPVWLRILKYLQKHGLAAPATQDFWRGVQADWNMLQQEKSAAAGADVAESNKVVARRVLNSFRAMLALTKITRGSFGDVFPLFELVAPSLAKTLGLKSLFHLDVLDPTETDLDLVIEQAEKLGHRPPRGSQARSLHVAQHPEISIPNPQYLESMLDYARTARAMEKDLSDLDLLER